MYEGMEQKIAVALLYDRIKAPTLTAKGSGDFAEEIVRKAEQANVPITEDKLLAATLAQLELNEEIPESLFRSVRLFWRGFTDCKEKHRGDVWLRYTP